MPLPKTGATHNIAQLGLSDNGRSIKEFDVNTFGHTLKV